MFIGRKEETSKLKEFLNDDAFKAGMIYGRRRVGKTEIIKQVLKDEKDSLILHCECKKVLDSINLSLLERETKSALHLPEYVHFSNFLCLLILDEFAMF